jgi:hypothetical protein
MWEIVMMVKEGNFIELNQLRGWRKLYHENYNRLLLTFSIIVNLYGRHCQIMVIMNKSIMIKNSYEIIMRKVKYIDRWRAFEHQKEQC